MADTFDVLICGGGLAGLTLALQLRQELPQLSMAVVERSSRPLPASGHKVGESSVELGSQYFERLGLREYLLDNHLVKFGLRFFPGGGDRRVDERVEVGPGAEPIVTSYQIDRGVLENDLRGMIVDEGVTLLEGAAVRQVELGSGGALHEARVRLGEEALTLRARWLVDATGRAALLRKKLGSRRSSPHKANAGWFRVSGRVDITQMVADPDSPYRRQPTADLRWRSTNHFMGRGYWAWVIPLAGERTSIGVVVHDEVHPFGAVRTLERCLAFLEAHEPHLAAFLQAHLDAGHEVIDFLCLQEYSHDIERCWSPDRWAVVGEAGSFVDPLYSPGSDFIALANSFTVEAIRWDLEGGPLVQRCQELDQEYRAFFTAGLSFFRDAAPTYGCAPAMIAKIYWDNFIYWSYHCQYFQQRLYALRGEELEAFSALGRRFFALNDRAQALLRQWALRAPDVAEGRFLALPGFPSLQVEAHVAVLNEMTHDDTRAYMQMRLAQAEELLAEVALRAALELGPEGARSLVQETGLRDWGLALSAERLAAESLPAEERLAALSPLARELDDRFHPLRRHPQAAQAAALLGARAG